MSHPYISIATQGDGEGANPLVETVRDLLGNDITASAADCLHALYEACDWSIENEAFQTTFGDLYWHVRWLIQEEWPSIAPTTQTGGLPSLGVFAETLGSEVKAIGEGFAQRLSGAYYGVMGYRPEHLFSHAMSLHKIPVGLWALQTALLRALAPPGNTFHPSGCWVVSHGQRPFVGAPDSQAACRQVAQLPARGVAAPQRIAVDVAHEIGHVVYNRFVARALTSSVGHAALSFQPASYIDFYDIAIGHVLRERQREPVSCWLTSRLPAEVFADAFAMAHLLGERFDLFARRVVEYLPFHDEKDSIPLLVRCYVQFCTACEEAVATTQGRLLVSDEWVPRMDETVDKWTERAWEADHHLVDRGLWKAFARHLRELARGGSPASLSLGACASNAIIGVGRCSVAGRASAKGLRELSEVARVGIP